MAPEPGGSQIRRKVVVTGVVQGVGFRPYVYALARSLGLRGSVANTPAGVVVSIEGDASTVGEFCQRVGREAPALAAVTAVSWSGEPVRGGHGFTIGSSVPGLGRTLAPPDAAICGDCLADLADPAEPTVPPSLCHLHQLRSALHHHQGAALRSRGDHDGSVRDVPRLRRRIRRPGRPPVPRRDDLLPGLWAPAVAGASRRHAPAPATKHSSAARRLIAAGGVLAVKGLGGYHLACDAGNEAAVSLLRKRKRRGDQPFAVMVAGMATADRLARLSEEERAALRGRQRPIVLAERRSDGGAHHDRLSASVAPGVTDIGLMLAYTPLHHLLLGLPGDPPGRPRW